MLLRCFDFYPRSPCGERLPSASGAGPLRYFYPRSPCGERPTVHIALRACSTISIHALLAESDSGDPALERYDAQFLSTLSLRRATSFDFCIICLPSYFYPRSPCGERQLCEGNRAAEPYFYPRSPCGERLQSLTYGRCVLHFYPRSPCGERLCWFEELDQFDGISIHALLAESDIFMLKPFCILINFYPRSPCGERREQEAFLWLLLRFLSTLSLRRATGYPACSCHFYQYFYPRSPCGERRRNTHGYHWSVQISIHALLAESDIR